MKTRQVSKFKKTEIGKIPAEWEVKTLGEISDITKLAGFEFTKFFKYVEEGEIIAIRALNVKNGFLDLTNIKKISKEISDSLPRSKLFLDDVLLTYTGSLLGQVALINRNNAYHLAPNVCRLRVKVEFDSIFLVYYLRSPIFQNLLHNHVVGSGQPTIPMKTIREIKVPNPKISEQQKISKILSILDLKIRNLQNQNKTLEQTIYEIFKTHFIDYKGITEFENSDLGQIPKEWKVDEIGNILKTTSGGTPSKSMPSYWNKGTIAWINSSKVRDFRITTPESLITEDAVKHSSTKLIPKKTTVMAITGATLGQVSILEIDSCISQNVVAIYENKSIFNEYVYLWIKHNIEKIIASKSGGAQQHINKGVVDQTSILIPPENVMSNFKNIIKPIFEIISSNSFEIKNVTKTRDMLLPKLMSGQIRV